MKNNHIYKIARLITNDPDIINEGWEELGIEDPNLSRNNISLTPKEEAKIARDNFFVLNADGSWQPQIKPIKPQSPKDLELHEEYEELFEGEGCFCSKCGGAPGIIGDTFVNLNDKHQIDRQINRMEKHLNHAKKRALDEKSNRNRFTNLLNSNPEISKLFKGINQVINEYGLKIKLNETEFYNQNLYLNYYVGGLNAIGNYVDILFELRLKITKNNKFLVETFSYWIDGGYSWPPTNLNDQEEIDKIISHMKEKGYDIYYKKYGNPILDNLSFHCRILPQVQTEAGLSQEDLAKTIAIREKELAKKEEYGNYKIHGDIEISPDEIHYGKDLWVEAMNAQHAIDKSGMKNAKVVGYMPPKPL